MMMKGTNRRVGYAFAFVLIFALTLGAAPSGLTGIEPAGVQAAGAPIRVGTYIGLVPYEYLDKSGQLTGFEVAILREIGQRLGRPVQFIDVQSSAMFAGLLSGKYEILASGLAILCQRLKQVDFSVPFYESSLAAFVRTDDPRVKRVEDLKGMVVGVEGSGTSAQVWLAGNQEKYGFKEIKIYQDMPSSFLDLETGRIDAVVQSAPAGGYYIRDKPRIEMRVQGLRGVTPVGLAFRKGDPLRARVDQVLDAMKKDGTMVRLHLQQIGFQPGRDSYTVRVVPRIPVPEGPCP